MNAGLLLYNNFAESIGLNSCWKPGAALPCVLPYADKSLYPRVWLHEGVNGRGWPLVTNDQINEGLLAQFAQFHYWSVSPIDLYDGHREVFTKARAFNPKLKILAHVLGPKVWTAHSDGWAGRLYAETFPHFCSTQNLSIWEQYARLDLPEVQAALVAAYSELLTSGCFDGLFLDWFSTSDTWIYAGNPTLHLTPWGGSIEAWDLAMRRGKWAVALALRSAFPAAILIGNGGSGGFFDVMSGWCRENFPNQNGGTWESNILPPGTDYHGAPRNGLTEDFGLYKGPGRVSPICLARSTRDEQAMRYALASSCMGDGALIVGPSNFDPTIAYPWWRIPEYSLDRGTGKPVDGPARPWLGPPTCDAYRIGDWWRREFVFGWASANPVTRTGALGAWT